MRADRSENEFIIIIIIITLPEEGGWQQIAAPRGLPPLLPEASKWLAPTLSPPFISGFASVGRAASNKGITDSRTRCRNANGNWNTWPRRCDFVQLCAHWLCHRGHLSFRDTVDPDMYVLDQSVRSTPMDECPRVFNSVEHACDVQLMEEDVCTGR
jgi:hypothetical protein